MSAPRRRLAAVERASDQPRFTADPARVYPDSEHLQAAYTAAIAWMRRGRSSRWVLDNGSSAPRWRSNPTTDPSGRPNPEGALA